MVAGPEVFTSEQDLGVGKREKNVWPFFFPKFSQGSFEAPAVSHNLIKLVSVKVKLYLVNLFYLVHSCTQEWQYPSQLGTNILPEKQKEKQFLMNFERCGLSLVYEEL